MSRKQPRPVPKGAVKPAPPPPPPPKATGECRFCQTSAEVLEIMSELIDLQKERIAALEAELARTHTP